MKILLLIVTTLLFSCEKENCKMCKIQLIEYGKTPVITRELFCDKVDEGYFLIPDSLGNMNLKMIACEK